MFNSLHANTSGYQVRVVDNRGFGKPQAKVHASGDFTMPTMPPRQQSPDSPNGFISPSYLPHSDESKASAPKKVRGQMGIKGMSSSAKRQVRSSCAILQNKYKRTRLAFLTGTLPGLPADKLHYASGLWGSIITDLCEEVKRECKRVGLPEDYVSVNEIQPKRLFDRGELAPHFHLVFVGKIGADKQWRISKERLNEIWTNVLQRYIKDNSIDCRHTTRVESIRKSIKNYLTKYMTKINSVLERAIAIGYGQYLPRRWHNVSANLKQKAKELIERLSEGESEFLEDNLEKLKRMKVVLWYYIITKQFNDREYKLGIVGAFYDGGLEVLKKLYTKHLYSLEQFAESEFK